MVTILVIEPLLTITNLHHAPRIFPGALVAADPALAPSPQVARRIFHGAWG